MILYVLGLDTLGKLGLVFTCIGDEIATSELTLSLYRQGRFFGFDTGLVGDLGIACIGVCVTTIDTGRLWYALEANIKIATYLGLITVVLISVLTAFDDKIFTDCAC